MLLGTGLLRPPHGPGCPQVVLGTEPESYAYGHDAGRFPAGLGPPVKHLVESAMPIGATLPARVGCRCLPTTL